MRIIISLMVLFSCLGFAQNHEENEIWQKLEQSMKPKVVKIFVANSIGLDNDFPYSGSGTGFIVDKKLGLVVTNRHIVSISPLTQLRINFFNNRSVPAKVLYVDPWHDFAFVKFDPKHPNINFDLESVELGEHKDLTPGETLMMIGHSSGSDYSVKYGTINKLFVNLQSAKSSRYTHLIHLSLSRAGGASGSPLWNKHGKVVGLHSSGDGAESYEIRIDYIVDALKQLQQNQIPKRGDLLLGLDTVRAFSAVETWDYPEKYIKQGLKENKDFHYALQVQRLIEGTDISRKISVGDFLLGVKGEKDKQFTSIGYSLYTFDKIINQNVGKDITLQMFRRNRKPSAIFEIKLKVLDANQFLPKRFVKFAGAIFHEITPSICFYYNRSMNGIFLNSAANGSSFDALGGRLSDDGEKTDERAIVIEQINGFETKNLDQLIKAFKHMKNGDLFSTVFSNAYYFYSGKAAQGLELSTTTDPLQIFHWNAKTLQWQKE